MVTLEINYNETSALQIEKTQVLKENMFKRNLLEK